MDAPELRGGIEAGIEIGRFFGLWLLAWSPIALALGHKLQWKFPQPPTPEQKIPLVLSLYLLAPPLLWWLVHSSGGTSSGGTSSGGTLQSLGWVWSSGFCLRIGLGLGLGGLSLMVFWGLEWALGWIRFAVEPKALLETVGPVLAVAIAISALEELLFRGFIATRLVPAAGSVFGETPLFLGLLAGLGLTNLIFALLHLPWDHWRTVVPQLPGLWLLGMVLSVACWRWGDLGLAIGLHGGWVWAIATLDTLNGIQATERVPAWVTGLGGSLLAGVAGVAFLALIGGGLLFLPL